MRIMCMNTLFEEGPEAYAKRVDEGMRANGYRYKLTAQDGSLAPIYAKTMSGITDLLVNYHPGMKFTIEVME